MSKINCFFAFIVCVCLHASCTHAISDKKSLISYVNNPENGLRDTGIYKSIKATLQYMPRQLIKGNPSKKDVSSKCYFVLKLSSGNKEVFKQLSFNDYSSILQTYSFRMAEYVCILSEGGKGIFPDNCLFQNTYGMSSSNDLFITFSYDKIPRKEAITFKVAEFGLNTGDMYFTVKRSAIEALNNINID